ncbi:hypothetical protein LIER_22219 [Lithospermum erythrorhizon]|uniref:Uncharacterized protein n=1 Tax=Lithospermum erythrorhizon TaxID=34254 RepID=A0AAV3QUC1_LITER
MKVKVTPHVRTPHQFTQPLGGLGAFHDLRLALAFLGTDHTLLLKGGVLTRQQEGVRGNTKKAKEKAKKTYLISQGGERGNQLCMIKISGRRRRRYPLRPPQGLRRPRIGKRRPHPLPGVENSRVETWTALWGGAPKLERGPRKESREFPNQHQLGPLGPEQRWRNVVRWYPQEHYPRPD